MVKITPTTAGRIKHMHSEGITVRQIGKELGIPHQTVSYRVRKGDERGHYYTEKSPGRPRKLDERAQRHLLRDIENNPQLKWETVGGWHGVSGSIARSLAPEHDIYRFVMRQKPHLTANHIARRLAWGRENVGQDWRRIIFTDESSIELGQKERQ